MKAQRALPCFVTTDTVGNKHVAVFDGESTGPLYSYTEFADEDRQIAESGLGKWARALAAEDRA